MPEDAYDEGIKTAQQYLQGIIDGMDGLDNAASISNLLGIANKATIQKSPESNSVENLISSGKLVPSSTVVKFYINDKQTIDTTIGELVNKGIMTGGNILQL